MSRESVGRCPNCGYIFEEATEMDNDNSKPRIGDISFCINCGAVNQFDELGVVPADVSKLDLTTQAEIRRIKNAWMKVQIQRG